MRPDGSSPGGYVIFVASQEEVESAKPLRLTVVDWASRRLQRVHRSSLAAETQAAATAVDELERVKTCWHLMLFPNADPQSDELARQTGNLVVTDAKSLYDAADSMSAGLKLSERRSAIELSGTNERLRAMGGHWKWRNSSQQLADGLTKASARALCLEAFFRGVVALKFDEDMVGAKKVKPEIRQAEVDELDSAARKLNRDEAGFTTAHFDSAESNKVPFSEDVVRCRLPGCNKEVPNPEAGQRFCLRRHYYKNLGGDSERARAAVAATVLASQVAPVEGISNDGNVTAPVVDHCWFFAIMILLAFVLLFALWMCVARRTTCRSRLPQPRQLLLPRVRVL